MSLSVDQPSDAWPEAHVARHPLGSTRNTQNLRTLGKYLLTA